MTETTGPSGSAPTATFHARVAGVGLVTTLVVLVVACLTFMLQQWAVARTQSHQMHLGLAQITATTEGPAITGHNLAAIQAPLDALAGAKTIRGAVLTDLKGQTLASYVRRHKPRVETIVRLSRDVGTEGQMSGIIECWLRNRRVRRAGRDKARMQANLERLLAFRG